MFTFIPSSTNCVRAFSLLSLLFVLASPLAFTACDVGGGDGDGDGDGDDDGDTCASAVAGRWRGGEIAATDCFGMVMEADVASASCTLTFSNWNMEMSVPEGADVEDRTLTFAGDEWSTCTGTLAQNGKSFTGSCDDAPACTFAMALVE